MNSVTQSLLLATDQLTTPKSDIPCSTIDPVVVFNEVVNHLDDFMQADILRFSLIGEESGKENKQWQRAHLPEKTDGSFEGYHKRVTKLINEGSAERVRYQFIIEYIERWSMPVRNWLHDFYQPIYDTVGYPSGETYAAIFIGDYKSTSFGIHFDEEYVFHVPLVGKKQMQLWHSDKHKLQDLWSDPCKEDILVSAEPGSCLFWTPYYWHVGLSSSDELSVSIANASLVKGHLSGWTLFGYHFKLPVLKALIRRGVKAAKKELRTVWNLKTNQKIKKYLLKEKPFQKRPIPVNGSNEAKVSLKEMNSIHELKLNPSVKRLSKTALPPTLKLDSKQTPYSYKKNGCHYVMLNGHIYHEGDTLLGLLEMMQSQPQVSFSQLDDDRQRALKWLYEIRAVSETEKV